MEGVDFLVGLVFGGAAVSAVWHLQTCEWRKEVPKQYRKFIPDWAGWKNYDNEASRRALKGCLETAGDVGKAWTRSKDEELDTFVKDELQRQEKRRKEREELCKKHPHLCDPF